MTASVVVGTNSPQRMARPKSHNRPRGRNTVRILGTWAVSLAVGLLLWWLSSLWLGPYVMPSPWATAIGISELVSRGTLFPSIGASLYRISVGWAIGLLVGAPVGILMGRIRVIRNFLDPYVEILRFIPAIALVTVMVVWFGIGETSKIALIVYTSVFVVVISTTDATLRISQDKILAARSLGAGAGQVLWSVVLPSAVPGIITGARLAMANSFLTIVSAEMVAAREGLGTIIWTSYSFGHIDWIFAGIVTLGVLGFCCDRILRIVSSTFLARFGVK